VLGAALLFFASAMASSPVGTYETRQMEVAAGLELKADHRFRYALSYGAVDEEGEGTWTFDGKTVRLTSKPMPKAPSFELVRDDPAPKGELYLKLEDPGFEWGHPLYALAADESKHAFEIEAGDSGRVDLTGKPAIAMVAPEMPVFGPTGDVFKLSQERGHKLLFRFHRNDLGKARFDGEPLQRKGGALLLQRYDTVFRFVKIRP
jgi:hypothetical protein